MNKITDSVNNDGVKVEKITRENYRKYKYLRDYRDGALQELTDEELLAQKFYLTDIYKGTKPPLSHLKTISMQSIRSERKRRKI